MTAGPACCKVKAAVPGTWHGQLAVAYVTGQGPLGLAHITDQCRLGPAQVIDWSRPDGPGTDDMRTLDGAGTCYRSRRTRPSKCASTVPVALAQHMVQVKAGCAHHSWARHMSQDMVFWPMWLVRSGGSASITSRATGLQASLEMRVFLFSPE